MENLPRRGTWQLIYKHIYLHLARTTSKPMKSKLTGLGNEGRLFIWDRFLFFFLKTAYVYICGCETFFFQFYNCHARDLILHLSNLQSRASRAIAQIASCILHMQQNQNRESGKLFYTVSKKSKGNQNLCLRLWKTLKLLH